MARMDNLLLGDLHGSVSGLTFYGAPGKQKVRMRTKPNTSLSANLQQSRIFIAEATRTWANLSPIVKSQFLTYATTLFQPHPATGLHTYTGFQAYVSSYKMWFELYIKNLPCTYSIDGINYLSPLSHLMSNHDNSTPGYSFPMQKSFVGGGVLPITVSKLEMRNDNFIKIRFSYAHTPPPVFSTNFLSDPSGGFNGIGFFASEQLSFVGAAPVNKFRYFLGFTGHVLFPPGTLTNNQFLDLVMDCSSIARFNNNFPGSYACLCLTPTFFTEWTTWNDMTSFSLNKVSAFSF